MKYLITGGAGFIGINLIHYILEVEPDAEIVVIDNLLYKTKHYLPNNVEFHLCDICCDSVVEVCDGVDAMIHLAANTGVMPSIENPMYDMEVNVKGIVNCLEACRHTGIKKFIFASSGAALGDQTPPLHERMLPKPLSPYGASKMAGENYCSAYYGTYGIDTIAFRFSNVYGPYSFHKNSLVSKFIKMLINNEKEFTIYGDGNQTRDFIYVDDLVKVLYDACQSDIGGEVFQLATGKESYILDIVNFMNYLGEQYFEKSIKIIYDEPRRGEVYKNYADISKVREMLEFKHTFDVEGGLIKTFQWFEDNI